MGIYLTNPDLCEEIKKYQDDYNLTKPERPQMSDKLGNMFLLLTKKIAEKPNFKNYTTIEDMKSEAIIKCIKGVLNFDLTRGTKPFSYFSQVVFMSFLQDINNLKKKSREIPVDFIETFDNKDFYYLEDFYINE